MKEKFWKDLNEYLNELEERRKVIVVDDMNAKVGNERLDVVVGKWGVYIWKKQEWQ